MVSAHAREKSRFPGLRLAAVSAILILSGCATWSAEERARLATVAVAPVTAAADAYHKPDAKISPNYATDLPKVAGAGALPVLMGAAIDAAVTSRQQRKFEAKNAEYFADLQKQWEEPPAAEVSAALRAALQSHEFFRTRFAEKSPNVFSAHIVGFGLSKSGLTQGEDTLLRVRITAEVSLQTAAGTTLLRTRLGGVASTAKRAREILDDPDFVKIGREEAAKDLATEIMRLIDLKLGRRGQF